MLDLDHRIAPCPHHGLPAEQLGGSGEGATAETAVQRNAQIVIEASEVGLAFVAGEYHRAQPVAADPVQETAHILLRPAIAESIALHIAGCQQGVEVAVQRPGPGLGDDSVVLALDLEHHRGVIGALVVASETHLVPVLQSVHLLVVGVEARRVEVDAVDGIAHLARRRVFVPDHEGFEGAS